ncbi:MAG: hypothetical protein LBD16_02925 [Oscillospiraceae bacterium]|jgi:hypothetical protein|nr:hypothetical protein [Oscillospiraceae bacterium]
MNQLLCGGCREPLCNDEIAVNLKLRGRAVGTFFCMDCLSERIDCAKDELLRMAVFFRENGCELFAREYLKE